MDPYRAPRPVPATAENTQKCVKCKDRFALVGQLGCGVCKLMCVKCGTQLRYGKHFSCYDCLWEAATPGCPACRTCGMPAENKGQKSGVPTCDGCCHIKAYHEKKRKLEEAEAILNNSSKKPRLLEEKKKKKKVSVRPVYHHARLHCLEPAHEPYSPKQSDEKTLVAIFDLLHDEYIESGNGRGFYANRAELMRAFFKRQLHVVEDWSEENPRHIDSPIIRGREIGLNVPAARSLHHGLSLGILPIFIVHDPADPGISKLWVHKAYRGLGYARWIVETLHLTEVWAITESLAFWKHLGFALTGHEHELNGMQMKRTFQVDGAEEEEEDVISAELVDGAEEEEEISMEVV